MSQSEKTREPDAFQKTVLIKDELGRPDPYGLETLEEVKISKEEIDRERKARIKYQKGLFHLALDVATEPLEEKDRELAQLMQLRAEEMTFADSFDGFHTPNRLLVPPVDPHMLVHLTQSLSIFAPLIDSMSANVAGFGQIYVKTIDLERPEDQDRLRDHMEGDLMEVLETDGIRRIEQLFKTKSAFAKSESKSTRVQLLEGALAEIDILKHLDDGSRKERSLNRDLALKIWKGVLYEHLEQGGKVKFEKVRERDFERRMRVLEKERKDEERFLKSFFGNVNPKLSFQQIRDMTIIDYESVGAWCLEFVRSDKTRIPRQIGHIPCAQVRQTALGPPVISMFPQRINDLEIVERPTPIKYRKYAQALSGPGRFVWFKEFGDERIMDANTGQFVGRYVYSKRKKIWEKKFKGYRSEKAFKDAHPYFREATELLYYGRYNAHGIPYSLPRWFGSRINVQGLVANETVNAELFDNQMVPPVAIKVSNGRLTGQTRDRIESTLETKKRGRENFWKVLTLEAESSGRAMRFGNTGLPTIEIEPLTQAIPTDATHQQYDEKGRLKIRSTFRLPPAHVGQESQYTRQSIQASKVAAEEQVFQPERQKFDDVFNKRVLPSMRINHWQFKTNSPPVADNLQMAQVLSILSKAGLITPGEVRPEVEQIFNRPLPAFKDQRLDDDPIPLVLIEAKAEAAQKLKESQSEPERENPQKQMGGRPDNDGMAIGSEVVKFNDLENGRKAVVNAMANTHQNLVVLRTADGQHLFYIKYEDQIIELSENPEAEA